MKSIIIVILSSFIFASVNQTIIKINQNKKAIKYMNKKLYLLAKQIKIKEKKLQILNNKIFLLNSKIKKLEKTLKNSNAILKQLIEQKNIYLQEKEKIQKEIINFISENYINSISKVETLNDLIKKEITDKILKNYSHKISQYVRLNKTISKNIKKINQKIKNILAIKEKLIQNKKILSTLIKQQQKEIANLKQKKLFYKQKLQHLLLTQRKLQKKLKQLKIISSKKKHSNNKYTGIKTIPPIQGEITKKFGSYIDPIYHIKIDNPSITITPYRSNEVVRAIMNGKVVFIGKSNSKGVIIIKHKNNLFSIYANLDKISPLLRKGSIVKKGQIIARVNHSLEFEITYKDKPINPLKVINIR